MEQRKTNEWRINSFWMKLLFILAAFAGVLNAIYFLYGMILGIIGG